MTATILIVDDDPDARALLSEYLTGEGYAVMPVGSGTEALAAIEVALPDIILLDAVMPGLDGFETCRRIKARDDASHIPIIFMTGLAETENVIRGLEAGGVDYVTKPLVLDALAARIRVHMGNARAARGAYTALASTGARLLSCDDQGKVHWAMPEVRRLLDDLDAPCVEELRNLLAELCASAAETDVLWSSAGETFSLTHVGSSAAGGHLVKLVRAIEGGEIALLERAFGLTPREAEVLLWTANGKSNKDMSDILNISSRTVNKHLEKIFIKLGVENRASAAAAATRVLANPTS